MPDATSDVKHLVLLISRAAAYSVHNQPGAAFSDCIEADRLLNRLKRPEHRVLSRRVKILQLRVTYALKLFSVSALYLASCSKIGVDAQLLDPYRKAIKIREEESRGTYRLANERDPLSQAKQRATFVGPIKVVTDPIKGRKVILVKDVKAGELLLMESPVLTLTYDGSPGVDMMTMISTGDMATAPSPHGTSWAVHRVMDDPSIGQCIHSLCPDPNLESSNLGLGDQERLRIFHKPIEIEVDLLGRQLGRNAFGADRIFTLRGLGSMISHSCKTNVVSAVIESDPVSTQ